MGRDLRFAVLAAGGLALAACSFQYHDLSGGEPAQSVQTTWFGRPAYGMYLCLSVEPGLPVYEYSSFASPVIGYTRDVVAFFGQQQGRFVEIKYYTGALGWIDGLKIRPYHGSNPGSTSVVRGVDLLQRPIFLIR